MQIGKYELYEKIGEGGFGEVYRAEDTTLGRIVALKILRAGLLQDSDAVKRFRREARAAADLFHPHIATILDIDQADGRLFLAMRYVDGLSLDQVIQARGALPWDEAATYIEQLCAALDFAHQRGLIHRDIKPANIMIGAEGAVLTDFGIAKASTASTMTITAMGGVMGTPAYIPPEIWHGQKASEGTDIYALACVIYELVTGKILFEGDTAPAVMMQHVMYPPKLERDRFDKVPAMLFDILTVCLSKVPAERPTSAVELWSQLEEIGEKVRVKEVNDQQATLDRQARNLRRAQIKHGDELLRVKKWVDALVFVGGLLALDPDDMEAVRIKNAAEKGLNQLNSTQKLQPLKPSKRVIVENAPPAQNKRIKSEIKVPATRVPNILNRATLLGIEWCQIPSGLFKVSKGKQLREETVLEFLIAKYPITNEQYAQFVDADGYKMQQWWTEIGWAWQRRKKITAPLSPFKNPRRAKYPIVGVSVHEAMAFCKWAANIISKIVELPTSIQWEKAARGVDGRIYPWGNSYPTLKLCNFRDDVGTSTPVGRYSPAGDSPYQCADMAGNVREWCTFRQSSTHKITYQVRGGFWASSGRGVRVDSHKAVAPNYRHSSIGFRCVVNGISFTF